MIVAVVHEDNTLRIWENVKDIQTFCCNHLPCYMLPRRFSTSIPTHHQVTYDGEKLILKCVCHEQGYKKVLEIPCKRIN